MRPVIDPETGEPLRMGAIVKDSDGHHWRRGRTRWSCTATVGTRYRSAKTGRMQEVARVGRLPWHALEDQYGPLKIVDLND